LHGWRHYDEFRKVVHLTEGIEHETPVRTTPLLYKAKSLHGVGLLA
jgi:hypothetical protein